MAHGLTDSVYFDDKRFGPVFERAPALDAPFYAHPSIPHQTVIDTYYRDYTKEWPIFGGELAPARHS